MANHGYPNDLGLQRLELANDETYGRQDEVDDATFRHINIHLAFGFISMICCSIGITGNTISLLYFLTKVGTRDKIITMLHKIVNVVDLGVCIMLIPVTVSNFSHATYGKDKEYIFSFAPFCYFWAFTWEVLIRLTVFIIGFLSIVRMVNLAWPLLHIGKVVIVVPLAVYIVILALQESYPYFHGVKPNYYEVFSSCGWDFSEIKGKDTTEYNLYFFLAVVLEFVLPFGPILLSCCMTVYFLKRKTPNLGMCSRSVMLALKKKRDATMTVVILTVLYIIFNIPYCVMWALYCAKLYGNNEVFPSRLADDIYYFISNMNLTYTIALNSTINPIVYICRTESIRSFARGRQTANNRNTILSVFTGNSTFVPPERRRRAALKEALPRQDVNKLAVIYDLQMRSTK